MSNTEDPKLDVYGGLGFISGSVAVMLSLAIGMSPWPAAIGCCGYGMILVGIGSRRWMKREKWRIARAIWKRGMGPLDADHRPR